MFMKRSFTLALILCLMLSLVGTVSAQEAAPAQSETADLQTLLNTPCDDAPMSGTIPTTILEPMDGNSGDAMPTLPVGTLDIVKAPKNYTDTDDALAFMRQQMKQRCNSFAFTFVTDFEYDYESVWYAFLSDAFMHTGVATEGDYLYWHMSSYGGRLEGDVKNNRLYITYVYEIGYRTNLDQERQVDAKVAQLLKSWNLTGKSDYQKVCMIYDYLCNNIVYDDYGAQVGANTSPLSYTAYKGLLKGTCVCQGYALLFYRFALECGIDARLIAGIGNGGPHGWNIVKLGNQYYNLDATWDATYAQDDMPYEFFLRSPSNFVDHYRYDEYNTSEFHYDFPMSATDYTPGTTVAGDMDGNESLTTDDAVYLLLNIMFGGENYTIAADANRDIDGDGKVNTDDAVYLLLHVMFGPKNYPLAA